MSSERFELRIPTDLLRRLDEARGHEPRASFMKRALESALEPSGRASPAAGPTDPTPASTRTPAAKPSGRSAPSLADTWAR